MLRFRKEERNRCGRRAPAGKYGNIPSFSCGKSFDRVEKGYSGVTHIYVRSNVTVSPKCIAHASHFRGVWLNGVIV